MIQIQGREDLIPHQSQLQAEGQQGDGKLGWRVQGMAQPLQPPMHWLAPPKCWLCSVGIKTEVKYSENLTFLMSEIIKHGVLLSILVSTMFVE